jgi:predicted Rossmann fold flavoprotein
VNSTHLNHVIVGGGAAGFFAAIACAQSFPAHRVILLEKTRQPLAKVRISGGGRCNVTHACFDPALLVRHYPRGSKELRGPFSRFQPKDTIEWFEKRGVPLKTEEDGRMFPTTDSSETIIACLYAEAKKAGVDLRLERGIQEIERHNQGFKLLLTNRETLFCDRLLMATGSAPKIYPLLEKLGHSIVPLVPSLFTFNVPDSPLQDLAGVSVSPVQAKIAETSLIQEGPLLITHWGFSGPAILKLSAWGARELHDKDYLATLLINWVPRYSEDELRQTLQKFKETYGARQMGSDYPLDLPRQLWRRFLQLVSIDLEQRWSALSKKQLSFLIAQLRNSSFAIQGKTTYKQEFVTCGGVCLDEVNFKTMESRLCPGLFFAGEILDIDGITGGFNFQNAWTTGWIAGQSMGRTENS